MKLEIVATLPAKDWAVVDMDTGKVLGTNVVAVRVGEVPEKLQEEAERSDYCAWLMGNQYGSPLYVEKTGE